MQKEVGEKRLPEKEGVIFLLFKNGKFLLEDRKHPEKGYFGYIIIPGGKVEKIDLNLEKAAERKVLEECSVVVKKMFHLDSFIHMTMSNHLYQSAAYLVTEFNGDVTNDEGKADHLWVSFEEAEKLLEFADSKYILLLAKNALNERGLLKD